MSETKSEPVIRERCGTYTGYQYHHRNNEVPCVSCLDARRVQSKRAYEANKPSAIRRSVAWQKKNPDKVSEYSRTYRRTHLEEKRQKDRRREARKLGNGYEPYTEAQVLEIYGDNCYLCDMPISMNYSRRAGIGNWHSGLHIDHLIPLTLGGPDTIENVRPSHAWCNMAKTNKVLNG